MKKNPWLLGILFTLLCVAAIAWQPTHIEAASQSDRNTYGPVFDAAYYYKTYPDVAAAYGMNETALFEHFVTYGVNEGRSASAEYNPRAYRARYTDLQNAFGNDMAAYCRHYLTYGRSEGRIASADGLVHARACGLSQTGTGRRETSAQGVQTATAEMTEPADGTSEDTAGVERTDTVRRTAANSSALGTYTTYYETGVSRATNVELAAQRINGVVVQPGGSFSFSNTILARTRANGYVEGPIFVRGGTSIGIGGGVCQVSSTLYAAMVDAGLPATERHAHSRQVDYMPAGLDATIAGDYLDLKFKNIYDQPLLIQADASGGQLTVTLILQ